MVSVTIDESCSMALISGLSSTPLTFPFPAPDKRSASTLDISEILEGYLYQSSLQV